jgi:hypothetical protein
MRWALKLHLPKTEACSRSMWELSDFFLRFMNKKARDEVPQYLPRWKEQLEVELVRESVAQAADCAGNRPVPTF